MPTWELDGCPQTENPAIRTNVIPTSSEGTLVLIRHAPTAENMRGVVVGRIDPPLDENGLERAHRFANAVSHLLINRLYSSTLTRSIQTATLISSVKGVPLEASANLREADFGILDGILKSSQEYKTHTRNRCEDKFFFRPQGGESYADVEDRVLHFLKNNQCIFKNGITAIVTHIGVIRAFYHYLCIVSPQQAAELDVDHLSVSILDFYRKKSVWGCNLI